MKRNTDETRNYNFLEEYGTDDPRLGKIIKQGTDGEIVLVGFPHDEGVRRNGGRVGAKNGPDVVRPFLEKMGSVVNLEYGIDLRNVKITDAGNISPSLKLEEAHEALRERVSQILKSGGLPFVIGGGNDESYPNAVALLEHVTPGTSVGVINLDAHLDVRPKKEGQVHSGTPFRLLLEDSRFSEKNGKFLEFATQGSQCSAEHWNYVLGKKNTGIIPLTEIRKNGNAVRSFDNCLKDLGDAVFVSFDLDSVSSQDAPGVSCPANVGLSAQEAVDICFASGKSPQVKLFDLSEFNPEVESYRTGRLVTLMFYNFVLGYALRKQEHK